MTDDAKPKTKQVTTQSLYDAWLQDPNPDNLHNVVKSMDNVISYKLSSMGVAANPQMRHQARLFAADAVRKFDPAKGANLFTWTQQQLQGLNRFRRENQNAVKMPDRTVIDAWAVEKTTRELEDELGYTPDVKTVADRSGLSVKRIAKVRKATRPVAASSQMYEEGNTMSDFMGEALEYVYDEVDPVDRKIIEMSTGYGGSEILPKNQIAARLGVSPSQITRRTERISKKLQDMDYKLERTYA